MTAREPLQVNDRFRLLEERSDRVEREINRLRERRSQRNVMKQVRIHLAFVDNEITGASAVNGKVKLGTGIVTLYRRDIDSADGLILHHVENGTKDGGEKARVYNPCSNRIAGTTGTGTGTGSADECKLVIIVEDKFGDLYVVKECDAPCPPSVTGTGTTGTGTTGTGTTGTTGTGTTGTTGTGTGTTGTTGTGTTGTGTGTTGTGQTGTGQTGTGTTGTGQTGTGTGRPCDGITATKYIKEANVLVDSCQIQALSTRVRIVNGIICEWETTGGEVLDICSCCDNLTGTATASSSPII